jgi:UDP-N-acetylglucosamine 2-epimerase
LPRKEYLAILKESDAIIGNSSSGIIEANFLGTPAVDIGERQRGREHGRGVLHTPYHTKRIVRTIQKAITFKKKYSGRIIPSPYGAGKAGKIIADRLARLLGRPDLMRKKTRVDSGALSR